MLNKVITGIDDNPAFWSLDSDCIAYPPTASFFLSPYAFLSLVPESFLVGLLQTGRCPFAFKRFGFRTVEAHYQVERAIRCW